MIELITGTPGAGKSLWALYRTKAKADAENRPVYYSGIADLKLPWTEIEPEKWFDCPPNSIVVIDECQRVFRPRSWSGEVPKYVSELETHRHKGIDLVFVTQHPMLIDSNVRRLVGKHFHVSRRFGMHRASVFEFESCKDQPLSKVEAATQRYEWRYPKEVFGYYKSAEVHTHKARIPAKFFVVLFALFLTVGAVWFFVNNWQNKFKAPGVDSKGDAVLGSARGPGMASKREAEKLDWFQGQVPRVAGMPQTAPIYDDAVKPVRVPYPAACVEMGDKCRCYTQQATALDTPKVLCQHIVKSGIFVHWEEKAAPDSRRSAAEGEAAKPIVKAPLEPSTVGAIPL